MIPKTIHYIWLGTNEPDEHVKKCMKSWHILKDSGWTIKKWDDSSLQLLEVPKVIRAALENKKYAFAADWLRLKILYSEGGVYLDTDVEVFKRFDDLLERDTLMFLGYIFVASLGTAVIGTEPKNQVIGDLLKQYETAAYQYNLEKKEFTIRFDFMPDMFMVNNNDMFTAYFLKHVSGFRLNGKECKCRERREIHIYPESYFEGYSLCANNNYAIHYCFGSWCEESREKHEESKLYTYLRKIYFLRWLEDKCMRKRMIHHLPFQHYLVKK